MTEGGVVVGCDAIACWGVLVEGSGGGAAGGGEVDTAPPDTPTDA